MIIKNILNKYNKIPIQAKASLWYTICSVLQKGISFLVIPIYIRLLTIDEYGQYSVFQSWKEIIMIFATLNLYCGVFTKAMVDNKEDRDRFTSSMQGLSTVITTLLFIIYLLFHDSLNDFFGMNTYIVFSMFLYFIFYPSFFFWSVRQKVENKYKAMVLTTLIISVMIPITSIFLLYTTNLRTNAIILGYLIIQCAIGAYFYILYFLRGKTFFHKKYWIKSLKFNIPLVPHYLSLIVLGQADKVMISYFDGDDKVAIYNLAYQVSMFMNIIISSINSTLVPWSYEKLKDKCYEELRKLSSKLCVFIAICTLGIILVAPEIISFLGTEEYKEATYIIPVVAISCYFTFCYNLFSTVEFYYNATNYVMIASITGAILNVILNFIFIPIYGYLAAGYTTLSCYLVFMCLHYHFMKKICIVNSNGYIPYSVPFIIISSLLLCILAIACILIYNLSILRYIILFIFILICLLKKEYILKFFKELK